MLVWVSFSCGASTETKSVELGNVSLMVAVYYLTSARLGASHIRMKGVKTLILVLRKKLVLETTAATTVQGSGLFKDR